MAGPLIKRRRVVAIKHETVVGTAEALSASDAAFNAFDPMPQPNIAFAPREGQGASLAPLPGVLGAHGGTVSFYFELSTDGASGTPAWASALLPACGYTVASDVWTPTSLPPEAGGSTAETVTIGIYEDGLFKVLYGCMGTFRIVMVSGDRIRVEFTMTGLWGDPTDVALIAPTYPTVSPIRFIGSTLTLAAGSIPQVQQVVIDANNTVILREDAETASGFHSAVIPGPRIITGTLNPEARKVADWDPHGIWKAGTEQALSILCVGGSGNKVTITAPKLQFTNVQEGDRNGVAVDDITFQLNRSASAGEDELSIDFSTV